MKQYAPLFMVIRFVIYTLLMYVMAEAIFYDAGHPRGESYFGEITLTEIGQEIILFILFVFYLGLGYQWRGIQSVSNMVSLFFLISFIREFNFLLDHWIYPVLVVLAVLTWLIIRDFRKIKAAAIKFFAVPPSAWLFSGFLVTYIFSRFMGRSKFWKLMYNEDNYRLAKAATEEGIELLGNTLMLIAAIEFFVYFLVNIRTQNDKT